jgi:lipid-A-disaccharide synthase
LTPRLLVSCGESSGDLYAGALARALGELSPGTTVAGLGGPRFRAGGGTLLADYRGMTVTGVAEALTTVPRAYLTMRRLVAFAREHRPDALVAVDFPDFNFPLARRIKGLGIAVIYYISPQIWAWRPGRLRSIREFADRMLVIFPFEEAIYREGGVPVEFVGHPLVELIAAPVPRAAFLGRWGLDAEAPTVAVLPGSRPNEVRRILPGLVTAAERIRSVIPRAQFVIACAPSLDAALFDASLRLGPGAVRVEADADAVLASADVALTASGTATIQSALHDTPMVIVYRVSPLTYLGRPLLTLDTFGMVNLIAGEKIVPELIQDAFTPEAVAREAVSILTNGERARCIRQGLARVRERLGGQGASRRAAEAVLKVVESRKRGAKGEEGLAW